MKIISNQLSLFTEIEEEAFRKTANKLLDLLNMDSKPKDFYQIEYYYQHNDFFVLIACNKEKKPICNVVDINGKIPNGFSVNWRNHSHIVQELKIKIVK